MLRPSKARALTEAALRKRKLEEERREAVEREIEAARREKRILSELQHERLEKKRQEIEANFPRFYDEIKRKLHKRAAEGHFYISLDLPDSHLLLEKALKEDGLKKTTLGSELVEMGKGHSEYWFSYFGDGVTVDKSEMVRLSTHLARWISVPSLFSEVILDFRQAQKVSDVIFNSVSRRDLEKLSTLAKTPRLSVGALSETVSKSSYEWPPEVRDLVCAEDPNPSRREFFSVVNECLAANKARERQEYGDSEAELEEEFRRLRQKLQHASRSSKAGSPIYYWGHEFGLDDSLHGRLFFVASTTGQKILKLIEKSINVAVARGLSELEVGLDDIETIEKSSLYYQDETAADTAIVECLIALGWDAKFEFEEGCWPLKISW